MQLIKFQHLKRGFQVSPVPHLSLSYIPYYWAELRDGRKFVSNQSARRPLAIHMTGSTRTSPHHTTGLLFGGGGGGLHDLNQLFSSQDKPAILLAARCVCQANKSFYLLYQIVIYGMFVRPICHKSSDGDHLPDFRVSRLPFHGGRSRFEVRRLECTWVTRIGSAAS